MNNYHNVNEGSNNLIKQYQNGPHYRSSLNDAISGQRGFSKAGNFANDDRRITSTIFNQSPVIGGKNKSQRAGNNISGQVTID